MEIKTTLLPGQNGTKALQQQYGDKLVCVRYRYDEKRQKRVKTIELIISERDYIPVPAFPENAEVFLEIAYGETDLRSQVKAAGGRWDPTEKAWKLPWEKALDFGLETRARKPRG